jgi:hypothetical protein
MGQFPPSAVKLGQLQLMPMANSACEPWRSRASCFRCRRAVCQECKAGACLKHNPDRKETHGGRRKLARDQITGAGQPAISIDNVDVFPAGSKKGSEPSPRQSQGWCRAFAYPRRLLKHVLRALPLDFPRGKNRKAAIGVRSDDGFDSHTSSQFSLSEFG